MAGLIRGYNMNKEAQSMPEGTLPPINELRRFVRVLLSRGVVLFGVIIILGTLFAAVFAPLVAPYDPDAQLLDDVLQQPNRKHLLGSDSLGRDTLSRIIFGSPLALFVGVGAESLAA